jgi:small-conductance mechanosensitive channel
MIYIILNLAPILLATLAGMLVGAVYLRLARLSLRGPGLLVTTAIAQGWFAAILAGALILAPAKAGDWTMALGSAVVIWIGFVAPVNIVTLRARRHGWSTTVMDSLYWLVVMVVQAVVLKSWGLVPPPL